MNIKYTSEEERKHARCESVRKAMKDKERINVILPSGTAERIKKLGIDSKSEFVRNLLLDKLDELEKIPY